MPHGKCSVAGVVPRALFPHKSLLPRYWNSCKRDWMPVCLLIPSEDRWLSSVLLFGSTMSLTQNSLIRYFLREAINIQPPLSDLGSDYGALTGRPFEPLRDTSPRYLFQNVAFLVAITLARRVSELASLSVHQDLCVFHLDRVVLRLDLSFILKLNSIFHHSQDLVLLNFCPDPAHHLERW